MISIDPIASGSVLLHGVTDTVLSSRQVTRPCVVLIHGFTMDGNNMGDLATAVESEGMIPAVYHYHSYDGLDRAAWTLAVHLDRIRPALTANGVVLVGHSMGGLVARYLYQFASDKVKEVVKGIVLLGTPNAGAIQDVYAIQWLLDRAQRKRGFDPARCDLRCRSAAQLTLTDSEKVIESMNAEWRTRLPRLPILSISGGKARASSWYARVAAPLVKEPHDGLVQEESADITTVFPGSTGVFSHWKDYGAWARTNHTRLPHCHEIASKILAWCRDEAALGQTTQMTVVPPAPTVTGGFVPADAGAIPRDVTRRGE
jgi:pimeloyl-ACP methyl ester carboxylesterase